jgi:putative peptidoglycan lipid II flippase
VLTPVKIGLLTLLATQAMNLAFIGPLKHAGLALAIGLGACLNAGLLYRTLRRHGIYTPQPGWLLFLVKVGVSVAVMAALLVLAMGGPAWWLTAGWEKKIPAVIGLVVLGATAYGACLFAFGFRARDFSRRGAS